MTENDIRMIASRIIKESLNEYNFDNDEYEGFVDDDEYEIGDFGNEEEEEEENEQSLIDDYFDKIESEEEQQQINHDDKHDSQPKSAVHWTRPCMNILSNMTKQKN